MLAAGVLGAIDDPWIRWSWISGHVDVITTALIQHIELTLIAVVIGLVVAVPPRVDADIAAQIASDQGQPARAVR